MLLTHSEKKGAMLAQVNVLTVESLQVLSVVFIHALVKKKSLSQYKKVEILR